MLARNLKQLRQRRRWTQQDLAKAADVTDRLLAMLENGRGNPTLCTLVKLAKALQTTVPELLLPAHAKITFRRR